MWIILLAFLALVFAVAPAHAADLKFPALTGRVVDDAHVLPADETARLTQKLADLESKTSRQLVVVTVASLQGDDVRDYGYRLGRQWAIGQKGMNNGTILLVAPTEHQVSIEVGYGLEPILTDALTSVILNTQVLPKFKAGDVPGGVEAGTDALIEQMSADPSDAEQKAAAAKAQVDQQPTYHYQHRSSPWSAILTVVFVLVVFGGIFGRRGGGGGFWPLLFLGGMLGGGGGGRDDDFGGGGGGGGGGGFSGGGGSFGGGGSSGSW